VQRAPYAHARSHADDYAATTAAHCHPTSGFAHCAANFNASAGFADACRAQRDANADASADRRGNT
jgi:hypothetical protein